MKFSVWSKHPGSEKQSVTMTLLVIGFIVVMIRFALSNMVIAGYTVPYTSGTDCSLVIAALGGLYGLRRYSDSKTNVNKKIDIDKEESRN
jgi:hypothetical protein